jgi:hypothetical protein
VPHKAARAVRQLGLSFFQYSGVSKELAAGVSIHIYLQAEAPMLITFHNKKGVKVE